MGIIITVGNSKQERFMHHLHAYVDPCSGYHVIFWFSLGAIRRHSATLDSSTTKDNDIEMGLTKVI